MRIKFGNTGSGDWLKVNEQTKCNDCCTIYNKSISDSEFVIYKEDIEKLISALSTAKKVLENETVSS